LKTWHDFYPDLGVKDFIIRIPTELACKISQYVEKGERILEAGIGSAVESIYLSHLGYKVFGIDNDLVIVSRAIDLNRKLGASARFFKMDMFKMGFKEGVFGIVFHSGVLEHYNETEIITVLTEQLKVAKLVIFSIPSDKFPLRNTGTYLEGIFGDENFWGLKKWKKILRNFKIIEIFGETAVLPKWKRFLIHLVYLPFWILNEKIWSQRYLPYSPVLGFVIKRG
jgi:2-polyprenyl-3-methyl-5-hydroxy-6-metoxy-1,4-benzoquinol methylase